MRCLDTDDSSCNVHNTLIDLNHAEYFLKTYMISVQRCSRGFDLLKNQICISV